MQIKSEFPSEAKMPTKIHARTNFSHILQPKHSLMKPKETEQLLVEYNISLSQLPKIKISDPALPEGANVGDIIKIERKDEFGTHLYYRVVIL